ncbi:MAG: dipeptide epimerase, partial [Verrucomicrobia bacterium]|nr:dipeptide epimerase [Cytophagales bacterium]
MKIKEIHVSRHDLQLKKPYTIAFKTVSTVENMVVRLELENGMVGFGSGNPSEKVTGESLNSCEQILQPGNLQFLIGRDIRHFRYLVDEITALFPKNPAARAALDIALHDAFCQFLGVSLTEFLGQKIESLPTSVTIGIMGVEETVQEALEYQKLGFKILKIKTGKTLEEDIERVEKLREVIGNSMKIRVDANQAYTEAETNAWFNYTQKLAIELVEQPVPQSVLFDTHFSEKYRKYIAADESLLTPRHAFELAQKEVCGIFNIKLMKCGGVRQALLIANIARASSKELMWGCNDESIISISAALHTALSQPHTKYLDLDGSFDLAKDVVEGGFILKDGELSVGKGVGLGVRG